MVDPPDPSSRRDLRFAVATEDPPVAWQVRCIELLRAVSGAAIVAWIRRPGSPAGGGTRSGPRAFAAATLPEGLAALPDSSADAAGPDACAVDVVVDLTAAGIEPALAGSAEIWRYRYGDHVADDPARAALIDYVRHPGRSRVALVESATGAVLRDGHLQWWRGEQLDRMLLDPGSWVADAARRRIAAATAGEAPADHPSVAGNGAAPGPAGPAGIRVPRPILEVAAVGRRALGSATAMVRHEDWNIGFVEGSIESVAGSDAPPKITWLPTRPGRYAADPFGVERDGTLHVFFEDFDQRAARGTIARLTIDPSGAIAGPEPVLDPGVHCSYPYVFEHDDRTFLLPETAGLHRLDLYESTSFPDDFRPVATLLDDVPTVDASVVEHEGRWWMFATRRDLGVNHSLFIWHAPDLFGPWTEHAANPVKTDSRSARPGGTPFVVDGVLYRPSQDCSRAYGGRLVINRVDVLTPTAFEERSVRAIEPPPGTPYQAGLHTLSRAGSRTLIDGNREHLVTATLRHDVEARVRWLTRRFR